MQGLVIKDNYIGIASGKDWINATLERLFSIELGEMVGALSYGTRLYDYIHTTISDREIGAILNEISRLLQYTMPMIIVHGLGVEVIQNEEVTGLVFIIEYSFVDIPNETYITKINKIVTI